ncbi:MAG: 3-deoxy-D-manno-octulosonic acid transferase [Chitinophagales bacterium]
MLFLYNIIIFCYYFSIRIAALFNKKAKLWIEGRKGVFRKISKDFNKKTVNSETRVWLHCASLGEFEQGRPLIEAIKKEHENIIIILTFFSPSGYEIRKNYDKADYIYYLPLDTKQNARKFIELVQPDLAIFVKYEFWYHYFTQLKQKNIPNFVVSAIFRPSQIFFKPYGNLFCNILKQTTHIFVQNEKSEELLHKINIRQTSVAPDTRFDRVFEHSKSVQDLAAIKRFKGKRKMMIIGSSWPKDDMLIAKLIHQAIFLEKFCFVIAPHEIKNSQMKELETALHYDTVRYSNLENSRAWNKKVLIIDNIGMLSSIYQYADYAYIGGGFGVGIHNVLEAAVFGMPIFFGTNYHAFQEAKDLIDLKVATSIRNATDLSKALLDFEKKPIIYNEKSVAASKYVKNHLGGTAIILEKIETYLE